MIEELDNSEEYVAKKMRAVFQASYSVEAQLLQVDDFPPLKRTLLDFVNSTNNFFGFWHESELVAVVEILEKTKAIHIQSLVVHPNYFRRGIGQKLLSFVFSSFKKSLFTVETGVDNKPAIALYEKNGFIEKKQWNTEHGIRKISFSKR